MIRKIKHEDEESFLSMVQDFYDSPAVVERVDLSCFLATFDAAMNDSPFLDVYILEEDGQVVGYAILSFTYANEVGGMVVLIEELYVEPNHRNRGIGSDFFAFVPANYPHAKRFRLEVRPDNEKAIALYAKLGYEHLDYRQMVKDTKRI